MFFLKYYLPKKFTRTFGKIHLKLIAALQDVLLNDGQQAIAAPRGIGKTTIVCAAADWALVYGHRKFVVIISANAKEAKKTLVKVRDSLESLGPLYKSFPEVVYPLHELRGSSLLARGQLANGEPTNVTISADMLRLPTVAGSKVSGSAIVAVGVKAAIRGQSAEMPNGTTARPDAILLDDVQTDEDAVNPLRVDGIINKIMSTIKGLSESGKRPAMILTGTVFCANDVTDQFLNRELYPHWNGIRGQKIETWPERMDLWREYRSRWFVSKKDAHKFYTENLEEMRRGAVVSWKEDFDPKHVRDALQSAMEEWSENERAFMSEAQNRPIKPLGSAVCVPAEVIMSRVNGLGHRIAPHETVYVTAFVDCHDDLLYWVVIAWSRDYTGFVLDYGTFPEQARRFFAKGDGGLATMKTEFQSSADTNLKMGLETLFSDLTNWKFEDENGRARFGIDRILVDAKYKSEVIERALRMTNNATIVPARGTAILARHKPMAQWQKKVGRVFGWHCIEERLDNRAYRSLLVDTNYWKSKLHEKFALGSGEKGSLSFWGSDKRFHRMVSEHCNAETVQLVSAGENEVNEWREKPARPDNHFFDCLVGATLAASTLGLTTEDNVKANI